MRRHLFSILLPFLMVGACQPATAPDAESVATQLNGPPGDDDPPEPHGTINPPPRNLRVTSNVGGAVIELDFDCAHNASLHEIFHQVEGGAWTKIDEGCVENGPELGHIYDNHGIVPKTRYCYKVTASNRDHQATSPVECVTSDRLRFHPVLPQVSIGDITRNFITVKIVDKSLTEQGFRLLRRVKGSGGEFRVIANFAARPGTNSVITHSDNSIVLGSTFEYKVNVFDEEGNNADTPIVEGTAFPAVPGPARNIATDHFGTTTFGVHWDPAADVIDKYHVTIDPPPSLFGGERDVNGNTLDLDFLFLSPGQLYCVTIVGENKSGVGPGSPASSVCVTTREQRPAPENWPMGTKVDLGVESIELSRDSSGNGQVSWKVCSFRGADDNFYVLDASIDGFPVPLSSPSGSIGNDACKDVVSARTPVSPGRHDVRVSARLVDEHGRDLFGGDPYPANNSLNRIFRLR